MKKLFCVTLIWLQLTAATAWAREGKAVGAFGMVNIQLFDTRPETKVGPGGGAYFDWRINQHFSLETTIFVTSHPGEGASQGDKGIEFLGIPTLSLKYYFLDELSPWDPFVGGGVGMYALSEGSVDDGSSGVGFGAHMTTGFDYYFTDAFSIGLAGTFHSIGVITGLANAAGTSNATAFVPYSVMVRGAFHF